MSIANDDSTVCDVCSGQFWPGSAYTNGTTDTVFELWPGFHACLGCVQARFERHHRAVIREDALAVLRRHAADLEGMSREPESLKVSTLAMLAWEAADPVRDGALDYASATARLLTAAANAGIDQGTARETVASAFTEASSWATAA